MGNLALLKILNLIYRAYSLLIFVRVLLSWIPNINMYSEPVRTIIRLTDVVLEPIRNLLDRYGLLNVIDISPIIALFLIRMIYNFLVRLLIF